MTDTSERLSNHEIGERLRLAREGVKLTQSQAAEVIGAARTTIVAIEQGKRRIQMDELQKLATSYQTSANVILRREAVHLDMVPRFRKLDDSKDIDVERATRLLNDLVSAEVELENALGVTRARNYPPERPILPGEVRSQAEQDAQELRDWLGLGSGPIMDIVSILDLQLGIRVYVRPLHGKVSGLFAYDEAAGACILLNANHSHERLTQTGAHELAHVISTRHQPEVLTEGERFASREERYANIFQRNFIAPARVVRQRFAEITAGQSHLTRRHVILIAHAISLSREATVRRLEELKLAREGTWDWFQGNGGITDAQVREVLGDIPRPNISVVLKGMVPPRLALLAREAWKQELYSEGQLARLLHLDRHGIREVLDGAEREEGEADELVKILR
ncbi:helix-turn-helix domain protein [Variibacter gotjawalensis]|uniref:Helix-turn-helix domain protein n=1 Tax=Variibacter gotjawalensis TaxID=1333996 RepID=A0A0S3PU22_9BRAD|nr:XRE family transcriptional regulator [Variibacter gotjawalensis]NIK49711.1 Zn-dependent peptidase ImmA (M78 family) [Variibacter gotjawalensis]RZS45721.1 Zn-dependent peptidase ImmA (M78 family) [Variibacter gotjawalensis]BAT59394.1 helix-turn-helix domain protein [Variibacter gotjawalensis]